MGRRMRTVIVAAASVAVLVIPLAGQAIASDPVALRARLTGANEAPGPGDPNGAGKARIWVDSGEGAVCFKVGWARIDSPFMAHIHRGRAGIAGPIRVVLFESTVPLPDTIHTVAGCVEAREELLERILDHPERFYVNVHNVPFPGGAIRGQLSGY